MQILVCLLFLIIKSSKIFDKSFYYSEEENIISIIDFSPDFSSILKYGETSEILTTSNNKYELSRILTNENLKDEYKSKHIDGEFLIKYYDINIDEVNFNFISLFYFVSDVEFKDIIFEPKNSKKFNVFPESFEKNFEFNQEKTLADSSRKRRNKKISETYSFSIKKMKNCRFEKISLFNYRKKKVDYIADLTSNLYNYVELSNENIDYYDFWLENLPEKFNLQITYALTDDDGNYLDKKILIIIKDIKYPNFKEVKKYNPNYKMIISVIIVSSVCLLATFIIILIKALIL